MGNPTDRPPSDEPAFDPRTTTVPRRRVLILMGAGALAAGGGLGVLLEACAGPPIPVELDFDPATLAPDTPTEVPFTFTVGGGTVQGSTWLVRQPGGDIVAFDPRCTHALCVYSWSAADGQFKCHCHDGAFAIDGSVLHGPPPRPLDRFPLKLVGDVIEVDVPSGFATPRESL
jgi:nitrite reductase/ring-hydroxylating ferredoxin subunit